MKPVLAWLRKDIANALRAGGVLLGVGLIGYGVALAWRADSATAVLAVGAVLAVLGALAPRRVRRLGVSAAGVSAEIESEAEDQQEKLAERAGQQRDELVPVEAELQAAPSRESTEVAGSPLGDSAMSSTSVRGVSAASHERGADGTVTLMLHRRLTVATGVTPLTCAVRAPSGFLGAAPRLVASDPISMGVWARYEAVFPTDFTEAGESPQTPGTYYVFWGTVAVAGGRPHVIATDRFEISAESQ